MTDFEYDCYQKKNIAHSAARRKCGSKSKRCDLSTDHMTMKQWNERCGDVVSYQIGKPMVWSEFSKLPKDLKEEYMNTLIEKYSANARGMADMFGVSVATVFRAVKKENLNVKFLKGRHPSGAKEDEFQRFLSGEINECRSFSEDDVTTEDDERLPEQKQDAECGKLADNNVQKTRLDSFTLNFSGEINIEMIANSLRYIISPGRNVKIQITCEIE